MRCLHGDLLSPLPEDTPLAMITANLPYVSTAEWLALAPEIRDHEPRAALDGGADGLGLIRRLLATAGSHLRPKGAILIEIGASQGASVTTLARKHFDRASVQLVQDYAGLDRLDERSRHILEARWLADDKRTLQDLADEYGISAERVRQLEANAMKKLREMVAL